MDYFDLINRSNSDYIERMLQQYQSDPRSVDPQWQAFFAGFEAGCQRAASAENVPAGVQASAGVESAELVHSYRELGHLIANLDPLGHNRATHPLLELNQFGLSSNDLDQRCSNGGFSGPTDGTVRDLLAKLRQTYCGTIGVQFLEISDKAQRDWLVQHMEPILNKPALTAEQSRGILRQIVEAQGFEEFLKLKYPTAKRFGLEGGESLIPLLNTLVEDGSLLGVEQVVIGMAHRGRLNTLAHVLEKPFETILAEFEQKILPQAREGDGDVKYHKGYSQDRSLGNGRNVHVAMSFNPSHLELVNPVVEGIVRAKQYHLGDNDRQRVVPILIHGDAAFTGQGIVLETLALSEMAFWRTGGTIHIIINNQIGFTTMPKQGRFTPYPTDVAKTIQAPVFHVNADDPEAVVHAATLAMAFRQEFHCDVMIDLYCYRRHGHNEADEPSYTQPLMYKEIAAHEPVREIYSKRLLAEGKLTEAQLQQMKDQVRQRLDGAYDAAQHTPAALADMAFGGIWKGMSRAGENWEAKTAISAELAAQVAQGLARVPAGFTIHPKLRRLVAQRLDMGLGKHPIDWGGAEALALGSLLLEGTPVRFVGQDAQRGTFSHRHACLHDYETGAKYYPLATLGQGTQPDFMIVNTMLSELAVLGFEYGFSSADPRNLVVWEAQFGDFVNGAQPIIDQFITAGESKWQKFCGLVMLLPHGYEGQGPEHSNAYLERFLSLSAENNIQVCVPSLPAQYFHLLRRQMKRNFRKPLVAMMPKAILRSDQPGTASSLRDLTEGSFQLVIDDPQSPPREKVRRLLLCCGKIFFTLDKARQKEQVDDVAIVRIEQLYPFPRAEIAAILARYRNVQEVAWVQEEPRNRGAWTFMYGRLPDMLPEAAVWKYYGREEAASPATGSYKLHEVESEEIITSALDLLARKHLAEARGVSAPK